MRNPAVPGHAMTLGSIPLISVNGGTFHGKAYCTCGAESNSLSTHKKRRDWFNKHKEEMRKKIAGKST